MNFELTCYLLPPEHPDSDNDSVVQLNSSMMNDRGKFVWQYSKSIPKKATIQHMQEIKSLSNVTFGEIEAVFNTAFSDYFLPIKFTKEQLEIKFNSEGGRLDLSVGVFEDNKLVAFILHFINNSNGEVLCYNGGTGVVPASRGNHLTQKMYEFISPVLLENNVDKMVLEVLTQNEPAIKTYKRQGFIIKRELDLFRGRLTAVELPGLVEGWEVVELKKMNWNVLQTFWDYPPTWQNSITKMNNLQEQNISFGVTKGDKVLGYIIYNAGNKRIHQMAVDKNFRNNGIGSQLLNSIYKLEKEPVSFINIDARSEVYIRFLEKRGLQSIGNQYEMEYDL